MKPILKFIAPVLLLAVCEGLFRCGLWEPLVKPESHAGTSVRTKLALEDPALGPLAYVTLGSSRPVYGLDHEALAKLAQDKGLVHANLSMPGSHWMTVDVLTEWLVRHKPRLQGGIIASDLTSFMYPGNGSYELGIVAPFRGINDSTSVAEHVPFKLNDMATWGTYSALAHYREDIQDYVRSPLQRRESVAWWREHGSSAAILLRNADDSRDMCEFGVDSVAACNTIDGATSPGSDGLRHQCRELRAAQAHRPDFGQLLRNAPLPRDQQQVRDGIRARLSTLDWQQPPVVVLMPLTGAWKEAAPIGLHEWTLSVLQPLADEGRIRLIDATDALAGDPAQTCSYYFDFYHQNNRGRAQLMQTLLPALQEALHGGKAPVAP
jgi:hypothetical protein